MVAERKEGRSMGQCWLLGGEALNKTLGMGGEEGLASVSGEAALLHSGVCSRSLFSLWNLTSPPLPWKVYKLGQNYFLPV